MPIYAEIDTYLPILPKFLVSQLPVSVGITYWYRSKSYRIFI